MRFFPFFLFGIGIGFDAGLISIANPTGSN
jgi:hypothetical protein